MRWTTEGLERKGGAASGRPCHAEPCPPVCMMCSAELTSNRGAREKRSSSFTRKSSSAAESGAARNHASLPQPWAAGMQQKVLTKAWHGTATAQACSAATAAVAAAQHPPACIKAAPWSCDAFSTSRHVLTAFALCPHWAHTCRRWRRCRVVWRCCKSWRLLHPWREQGSSVGGRQRGGCSGGRGARDSGVTSLASGRQADQMSARFRGCRQASRTQGNRQPTAPGPPGLAVAPRAAAGRRVHRIPHSPAHHGTPQAAGLQAAAAPPYRGAAAPPELLTAFQVILFAVWER